MVERAVAIFIAVQSTGDDEVGWHVAACQKLLEPVLATQHHRIVDERVACAARMSQKAQGRKRAKRINGDEVRESEKGRRRRRRLRPHEQTPPAAACNAHPVERECNRLHRIRAHPLAQFGACGRLPHDHRAKGAIQWE
eukprot:1595486-Prymnesium_polylepis.1